MASSRVAGQRCFGRRCREWFASQRGLQHTVTDLPHTRLRTVLILAVALVQIPFGQAVSAGQGPSDAVTRTVDYSVGITGCTFVDRTRGVLDYETAQPMTLSSRRRLVTEIRYTTLSTERGAAESAGARPSQQPGGYPMIVFAHGLTSLQIPTHHYLMPGSRRVSSWRHCSPRRRTRMRSPHSTNANTEDDLVNEPADLAFVTRQILAGSATRSSNCP